MQTFITSKNLQQSAYALWEGGRPHNRLNNQINEGLIVLRTLSGWYLKEGRKGWPNHSCTRAWAGYEIYLIQYLFFHIREYERLSHNDCSQRKQDVQECCELKKFGEYKVPHWLTDEFVSKHRSLLLGKVWENLTQKENELDCATMALAHSQMSRRASENGTKASKSYHRARKAYIWYQSFNWLERPAQPLENGKWPDLWKF